MIYSLHGHIVEIRKDRVAIDLGPIGYEAFVSRPDSFSLGQETTLYCAEVLTQDDHYLVAFPSLEEKNAYESLTSVKGIGPKTAIAALSATTPEALLEAIVGGNVSYLKKLPGIGPKAASQIILDLKGKLVEAPEKVKKADRYPSLKSALKGLGFKVKEIEPAINALPDDLGEEEALRQALRNLRKAGQ